jgi:hypothetical protein
VVVRAGRAAASLWRALLACSLAAFTAWRPRLETASQPASRPRPTSDRHHGPRAELRRCLRRCRDITSTSRPPPADWVALLFPCSPAVKRTAARWRGASQASRDRLPPADPHRRCPRHPRYWPVLPGRRGLAPSSESMTTPGTRSRREPGCRQGPQPLHRHGLEPSRALAMAAWLGRHRLVTGRRRWPGPARRVAEATCSRTGSRSSRPLGHGLTLLPDLPSLCGWPAAPTSAITRTDPTDLTRLSLQPSTWWAPVGGCRLVVRSGRSCWGGSRAAGSVGVAEMRVRRANLTACNRRGWAGWWGR